MGIHAKDDNTIVYREWAPNAVKAALFGEFSTRQPTLPPNMHRLNCH